MYFPSPVVLRRRNANEPGPQLVPASGAARDDRPSPTALGRLRRLESKLPGPGGVRPEHAAKEVPPTQHLIAHGCVAGGIGNDNGVALSHHLTVHDAGILPPGASAPAQHLHMHRGDLISKLDQTASALEQLAAEVGDQPEAEHVDVVLVDELGKLINVLGGQESRLVDDEVIDPVVMLGDPDRS